MFQASEADEALIRQLAPHITAPGLGEQRKSIFSLLNAGRQLMAQEISLANAIRLW
jgi:hypothetical protein